MILQTRIFAILVSKDDEDHWKENLLGKIIKPTIEKFPTIDWFFFSFYTGGFNGNDTDINQDCNIQMVKEWYKRNGVNNDTYSIRFRFSISEENKSAFIEYFKSAINHNHYFISDVREYLIENDLGSLRHLGGERSISRIESRVKLLRKFYHATSLLTLDNLIYSEEIDSFRMEVNEDYTTNRSSFTVPHHLYCNITNVPLAIEIRIEPNDKEGEVMITTNSNWGYQIWKTFNESVLNYKENPSSFWVEVSF